MHLKKSPFVDCHRRITLVCIVILAGAIGKPGLSQTTSPSPIRAIGKPRPATLSELYQAFFSVADHVENRSVADEKNGYDRMFYRHHLQRESGLAADQYNSVLGSAKRYASVTREVNEKISQLMLNVKQTLTASGASAMTRQTYKMQLKGLYQEKTTSRDAEITSTRLTLGKQQADMFESYLQGTFAVGGLAAYQVHNSVDTHSANSLQPAPEVIPIEKNNCQDYIDADYEEFRLCAVGQASYLGRNPANLGTNSNLVEFIASNDGSFFDDLSLPLGVESEGDLYQNDSPINSCELAEPSCSVVVELGTGQPTTYGWGPTETIGFYDSDGVEFESFDGGDFDLNISPPDINALQFTVTQGVANQQIVIDGDNTVSPFQNNPTVSINTANICAPLTQPQGSFTEPNASFIVNCSVPSNAVPGTYTMTISNGFGSDTVDLVVKAPPPTITSVSTNAQTLVAGQSQTVVVTGTHFGTNAPTITQSSGPQLGLSALTYASNPSGVDIVTFVAQVPPLAPASSVTFELQATSGSQTQSVTASQFPLAVVPVVPSPQIMVILNTNDLNQCLTSGTVAPSGNNQTNVSAGQLVMLCVPPPPSEYGVPSSKWELDNIDDITGGFVDGKGDPGTQPTAYNGGSEAADPSLNGGSVAFYYVNPNSTETFAYTWNLVNGSATTTADFMIQGPSGNLMPNAFTASDITGTSLSSPQDPIVATLSMTNAPFKPGVGVYIIDNAQPISSTQCAPNVGAPPTTGCGQLIWTQILTSVNQSILIPAGDSSAPLNAANQLDGTYPYFNGPGFTNVTWDSPSMTLLHDWGEGAETFDATMYVLWDPALPAGCVPAWTDTSTKPYYTDHMSTCTSTPIPLGSVQWNWSACAINALSATPAGGGAIPSWFRQCGVGSGISSGAASGYPQWTSGTGPGGCSTSLHANCQ